MSPAGGRLDAVCAAVRGRVGSVETLVDEEVRRLAPLATAAARAELTSAALARLQGLGELERFLQDHEVTEVLVNAGAEIWVERGGALQPEGRLEGQNVIQLVERVLAPLGRRVDSTSPIVDARLPDRSRVCAVVPPLAVDGPCLSIRRFPPQPRPLSDFADSTGVELCRELLEGRDNVVVSGATSSGKTSLVAGLLACLDPAERTVVIEDTAELPVGGGHVVRLEARPPSPDGPAPIGLVALVRAALRLRPDRLVVGEVRGDEVLGLVQALNTGHDGSLSTCHANGPLDALYRLETLLLQAAPAWPLSATRQQLTRSVDAVVHVARRPDGRRVIETVAEVDLPAPDDPKLSVTTLAATTGDELVRYAPASRARTTR